LLAEDPGLILLLDLRSLPSQPTCVALRGHRQGQAQGTSL